MNERLDTQTLLADRHAVYQANYPHAQRSDADETWFFSPDLARVILSSTREFSSRRERLSKWLIDCNETGLATFYERWLMYTDGTAHKRRRSAVNMGLGRLPSVEFTNFDTTWAAQLPQRFDLVNDFASVLVWLALPRVLGIPDEAVNLWRRCIPPLVELPGQQTPSSDSVQEAKDALRELRRGVMHGAAGPLFHTLRVHLSLEDDLGSITDIAINVIGDSIHPTIAALSTEIWLRVCGGLEVGPTSRAQCLFHDEAPFQYAARVATQSTNLGGVLLRPNDRVVACLGFRNAGSPALTFGHGPHSCPGRGFAEKIVMDGTGTFFSYFPHGIQILDGPVWKPSVGYRAIERLTLSSRRS